MQPSPRLHKLIQSLSPTEQRYFKLFAQRHKKGGENLYLKLFNAIHRQKSYDEPAIKDRFQGTSFGKSLAFPKSNLYDQVLRSLQAYHFEKSKQAYFRSAQDKVELLIMRGLYQQGLRILNKAMAKAEEFEQANTVLQMMRVKRELLLRLHGPNVLSQIALLAGQEQAWEKVFQAEQLAIRLRDSLLIILQEVRRKTQAKNESHLMDLRKELDDLHTIEKMSFQGKVALFQADAHYYHLMDEFHQVHTAYDSLVKLWKRHPHQVADNPSRYANAVSAWLYSKAQIDEFDEALSEIQKWRSQEGLDEAHQARVFKITFPLELFIYLNSGQFTKAIEITPDISDGLKKFKSYLSPNVQLALYYNLVLMHLLGGKPKGGLHWANRILQMDAGEIRKDIQAITPLLEKILHYELGNFEVLESWFRAVDYRQRKNTLLPQLDQIILKLLKGLLDGDKLEKECYREFLTQLREFASLPKVSKIGLTELELFAKGKLQI